MPPRSNRSVRSVDFWDAVTLYNAANSLTGSGGKGPQYAGILEACSHARGEHSLPEAEQIQLLTATDPANEGQSAWRGHIVRLDQHRIVNVDLPFWDTAITLPPAKPDDEKPYRPIYSLAPLIAYQLGVLSSRPSPSIVIASNAFELAASAADLVDRANATVVIAFWKSLLDPRWERGGYLLRPGAPLRFFDFEPVSRSILGVDFGRAATEQPGAPHRRGLPV